MQKKYVIPSIAFIGILLISLLGLKLSTSLSVVLGLLGFGIAYFLGKKK